MDAITWRWATFADMTLADLYAVLALRQRIFVVEQACAYLDADGLDARAWHLIVKTKSLVGTLRVLPAGTHYPEMSIGRVCLAPEQRRTGLGREMMRRTIARFGDRPLALSAQTYLLKFYEEFGFVASGEAYDEDGIPHIKMTRAATKPNSRPPAGVRTG